MLRPLWFNFFSRLSLWFLLNIITPLLCSHHLNGSLISLAPPLAITFSLASAIHKFKLDFCVIYYSFIFSRSCSKPVCFYFYSVEYKKRNLNNLFTVIFHMTVMLHCKSSLHMFRLAYCVRLHHTQVPRVFSVSVIKPGMECQDECDFRDSVNLHFWSSNWFNLPGLIGNTCL